MSDYAYRMIMGRPKDGCRYIIGDVDGAEEWRYCGSDRYREANGVLGRLPYCDKHFIECVQPAYSRAARRREEEGAASKALSAFEDCYILDEEAA